MHAVHVAVAGAADARQVGRHAAGFDIGRGVGAGQLGGDLDTGIGVAGVGLAQRQVDEVVDVADQSTNNILSTVPVVGSIAQGTKELLRNRRTENAKPIYLGSNQKVLLKII